MNQTPCLSPGHRAGNHGFNHQFLGATSSGKRSQTKQGHRTGTTICLPSLEPWLPIVTQSYHQLHLITLRDAIAGKWRSEIWELKRGMRWVRGKLSQKRAKSINNVTLRSCMLTSPALSPEKCPSSLETDSSDECWGCRLVDAANPVCRLRK